MLPTSNNIKTVRQTSYFISRATSINSDCCRLSTDGQGSQQQRGYTRISIESNFVTYVVSYTQTEEAPEEPKAKYMTALNSTVASVFAREYVFVFNDPNARTGKRGEGGGEEDSKVLGTYG